MPIHPSSPGALCGYPLLGRGYVSRPYLAHEAPRPATTRGRKAVHDPSRSTAPRRRSLFVGRTVPILAYHKVAEIPAGVRYNSNYVLPSQFAAQLNFLRRARFQSITFAQYESHRLTGAPLPRRPVLITFDDGYRSNRDVALPLLRRFGFSATVFLVSDLIGCTNRWDADEIQEPLLSLDDIRVMRRAGIDFQSHTCTHRRLTALTDADMYAELVESRRTLENALHAPVSAIAYPWGECTPLVQRLARAAGYHSGVILRRRTNFAHTPLFELRRIGVNHATSLARFGWDLLRLRWRGD
jgi:peptidoglycan/xylan/chitin deacetylase (PgdA/CDA1 family)